MPFDAARISNNILKRAFTDDIPVSPMKLQKIMYFAASEYAKKTDSPLIMEPFQVWTYGPVISSVYSEFKPFGGRPIKRYSKDSEGKSYMVRESTNPVLREVLDAVWDATYDKTAVALSRITHLPEAAWTKAFKAHEYTLNHEDIAADTSYQAKLGLG